MVIAPLLDGSTTEEPASASSSRAAMDQVKNTNGFRYRTLVLETYMTHSQPPVGLQDHKEMDDIGFLDMMNVGIDEVNWSETEYSSPAAEQERMSTIDVSAASSKSKSKQARVYTKGKNWTTDEDMMLIKAWANTSLDAVIGTDQNSNTYWDRILEYYNLHKKPSWSERNANAINCRYTTISTLTSRFCACVQQIINKNQSGKTLVDKERDAQELYIALDPKKKPFTLMHCYIELQKYPKWETRSVCQKKQKKTYDASPGSTSNDEQFEVCSDVLEQEQRPRGTKYEKQRRGKTSDGSGVKLSLESVWAQRIERDGIKEATKSARYERAFELQAQQIELQKREDARKEFELEEKVMFMDTTGMSDAQKQFYKHKQDEIMARRHHTSG